MQKVPFYSMIKKDTYTIEWIKNVSRNHRNADPILIEKAIRALALLQALVINKLDFVFKGGTSLLLLFEHPKRLSIDIDIILNNHAVDLEPLFTKIASDTNFIRWEEQTRKKSSTIEKAHYKFFYTPIHKTNKEEEYILLDILFEANHYPSLTKYPIKSSFLQLEGEDIMVVAPIGEGLLGDKLTAFAPNTTGIPYEKNGDSMTMEIIKQLYDINNLFDISSNMEEVRSSFSNIAQVELQYRNHTDKSIEDVYKDIIDTSLTICSRGVLGAGNYSQLQDGIQRVSRFIFAETFHLDKAITAAAKAAYLANWISKDGGQFNRYSNNVSEIKEFNIEDPAFNKLNKLKKSNPEAFYYWYHIITQ